MNGYNPMTDIQNLPLTKRHIYIVTVSSMEQIIGASLSTIVGVVLPLLNLFVRPELSATTQGIMGATGLVGIAVGSAVIGPLSDRQGYLNWFRTCAMLIILGSLIASFKAEALTICMGMFVAGFGVGGGYTLDSAYISELMPDRWRNFMVGVAKASCAIGFLLPALIAVIILHFDASPRVWRDIVWIMGGLGVITLVMRIYWAESPRWLVTKGRTQEALKAAQFFFGKNVSLSLSITDKNNKVSPSAATTGTTVLFKGKNLLRVIYSGIPWACEGLGVYGIGVFLPLLIMALGIDNNHAEGIAKIINSVELTAVINFCILPGFIIGLLIVEKINNATMLWVGFVGSALGMALLLAAYLMHWPLWVSVAAFIIFEVMLNGGPHLVTYIIPAVIYPVQDRGAGSGVADFLGKLGAILGVFFMPLWLKEGGVTLVLEITIGVMMLGAVISIVFSRILGLNNSKDDSRET